MALRSIVEIEVDDSKFRAFAELFQKFQQQLSQTPAAWAKAGEAVTKNRRTFEAILAAMLARDEVEKHSLEQHKKLNTETKTAANLWQKLVRHSHDFASNLKAGFQFLKSGTSLLARTGGADLLKTLLGVGGITFGFDRLAAGVASRRRLAMGLGITYGEGQAFGLNFNRFVDPESMLGNVATGLYDIRSPQFRALLSSGVSMQGDPAAVAVNLLRRLPQIFAGMSPNSIAGRGLIGARADALGITSILSLPEIIRNLSASPSERARQIEEYRNDKKALGLSPVDQLKWTNFLTAMGRAGKLIEKTLIQGLAPLATPLERLAHGFSNALAALLGSKEVRKWIDRAAAGLKHFAGYVDTPQFEKDVHAFVHNIGELASKVAWALRKLGILPQTEDDKKKATKPEQFDPSWSPEDRREKERADDFMNWILGRPPINRSSYSGHGRNVFSAIEAADHLPRGLLWGVEGAESNHGRNVGPSSAGAEGPFQFMPGTARQYGLANPYDRMAAADAAGRYFADLMARFHGNSAAAIAAYNWGPGNVARDMEKWGRQWREHLPRETARYLNKVLPNVQSGQQERHGDRSRHPSHRPVKIEVRNATGSNLVISSSQLAV